MDLQTIAADVASSEIEMPRNGGLRSRRCPEMPGWERPELIRFYRTSPECGPLRAPQGCECDISNFPVLPNVRHRLAILSNVPCHLGSDIGDPGG
jgi:hypothetical protein